MNWRHYTILFVIGLIVPFAISRFQSLPGYMDADYYFAGGIQLAEGRGFTEPYLWNYLDDPDGLPHPSHTYWMPLASIVSALGMWITGQTTYAAGRAAFILLSACVPLLIATLAFDISRQARLAMVSGLLSIFSMYYASFMPVPDNYALYMLLGGSFLLLAPRKQKWIPVALGVLAGLMTLARSDGLLWLGLAGLTVMWKSTNKEDGTKNTFKDWFISIVPAGLLVVFGYLITMGFWHVRSMSLFDSFMTPGGGRLLWLQNYNETFIYPAENLTREGFLEAGWDLALQNRIDAFSSNLSNTFAAQGEIFLFPFMLIGLWQLRKDLRTKIAVTGWLILFAVMTVIFPFAGSRGSFFHAGAAFQPFWWVAAPIGLDALIEWARRHLVLISNTNPTSRLDRMFTSFVNLTIAWLRRRSRISDENAPLLYQVILVLIAVFMTGYLVNFRVIADWAKDDAIYASVEKLFQDNGISPMDVVIVRNPPGYYINSERPAISLPFGDESTILQVAERYQAGYLVLEKSGTFESIQGLYDDPQSNPSFFYLGEVDDAKLYRIELAR